MALMHTPDTLAEESLGKSAELARQEARDQRYRESWSQAPESFRLQASAAGIGPHIERQGAAIAFEEDYASASYTPDVAAAIDSTLDMLIEKHGNPELVKAIVASLEEPMRRESERTQAGIVARVVCYIVKGEKGNVLARIHGLMHAIPRLAAAEGFGSMSQSAIACGVSREWMKQMRDFWCDTLAIPVPKEGTKSEDAKRKYRDIAIRRHHTRRKLTA